MPSALSPSKALDLIGQGPTDSGDRIALILATCGQHRLVEYATGQGDDWLEVCWNPPRNGSWYRTDGGSRPLLMPGTMTTELAVQAGELLIWSLDGGRRPEDGVPVLGRISKARFTAPVPPGEQIVAMVKLRHRLGPAFYVDAVAHSGAKKVMTASLTFTATAAVGRWLEAQP